MQKSGLGVARALLLACVLVVVPLALAELGLRAAVAAGAVSLPRPRGASPYWDGSHPRFGVWRHPSVSFRHVYQCLDTTVRSNAVGARDRERSLEGGDRRVIVLGDSFVDGWGVREGERFSDRLERTTGLEHLNFGMSHFGPYQQVVVYRELASRYEHAAVMAIIYPGNDFVDLDADMPGWAGAYEYRYRPYLVPEGDGFRHVDVREPGWQRWARQNTYLFQAVTLAWRGLFPPPVLNPMAQRRDDQHMGSYFYDFGEERYALLEHSLGLLAEAVVERPLVLVLAPDAGDLERYRRSGADPLSQRLARFAARRGIHLVNLLPLMHEHRDEPFRYFHPCDFHWSARGHAVAARLLRRALTGVIYEVEPADPGGRANPSDGSL